MAEKDTYKELSDKMFKVFGREALKPKSWTQWEIIMMVGQLVKTQGLENITEKHLIGIRDILDGKNEPTFHIGGF